MGNSATFKCMANHTSFAFPTDVLVAKNLFYPSKDPHARPLNNNILAESFEDKEYDDDVNEEASVQSGSCNVVVLVPIAAVASTTNYHDIGYT